MMKFGEKIVKKTKKYEKRKKTKKLHPKGL